MTAESAGPSVIKKALPHFLDHEGRHALSPSLYERDAYQALLRENPDLRSTVRFDILWDSAGPRRAELYLKVELRGAQEHRVEPLALRQPLGRPGWLGTWSKITVPEEDYQRLGEIVAWRVSLWEGDQLLAEKESFLWTGKSAAEKKSASSD